MSQKKRAKDPTEGLPPLNLNAAGIDVGDEAHWVAVPSDRDKQPVRKFGSFTADVRQLADWLEQCGIETVVMESTGVYWVALYDELEKRGMEANLVHAGHAKQVPGRKSDVKDCQWLQTLHTYGLLSRCFRPAEEILILRTLVRQQERLTQAAGSVTQHMQQALTEMNLRLDNAISDVTGVSGLRMIRAIVGGERNAAQLAAMRDGRIRASAEVIEKSLEGNWKQEQLFVLEQALAQYDFYQTQMVECEKRIQEQLARFESKRTAPEPEKPRRNGGRKPSEATQREEATRRELHRITAVDLTRIPGIDVKTAQVVLSEIGLDMSAFPSAKNLASHLGLCPDHRITGGKVRKRGTRKVKNRAATALHIAANSLRNSRTALGAKFRRFRARLGDPKAITAMAHMQARLIYNMLKHGQEYVEAGMEAYEKQYHAHKLRMLIKQAKELNMTLVPTPEAV